MTVDCLRAPDYARAITENESALMERCSDGFALRDIRVKIECARTNDVYVAANESAVRFIALRWNGVWPERARFLGDTLERGYGHLAWRGLETDHVMCWYFAMTDGARHAGYGVKVRPDALCYWTADGEGVTLWLDIRNGAEGVLLRGRELLAAQIVTDESESPNAYRFLQSFMKKLCDDPITPDRPVYGGNNWCYAYGDSSHQAILKDAALIRDLSQGLENRPFMVIDDGWQELARTSYGDAQGRPYERGNSLFPDMPGLAASIRDMGVRPGIWMRPLRTGEKYIDSRLLLKREKGYLDPSLKGTLDLIAEDIERLVAWGYELIKYDFVQRDIMGDYYHRYNNLIQMRGWRFADPTLTTAEIMKAVSQTIYDHAHGALLLGCNVSGHLAAGRIHMHRSGDDTSGREYSRSVKMGVNCLAFRLAQHKAFFDVDADCICVTNQIDWARNKELLRLYENSGTVLFVSAQPEAMNDEILSSLRRAFQKSSVQKEDMEPLDWLDTALPERYLVDGEHLSFRWANADGYDFPFMS